MQVTLCIKKTLLFQISCLNSLKSLGTVNTLWRKKNVILEDNSPDLGHFQSEFSWKYLFSYLPPFCRNCNELFVTVAHLFFFSMKPQTPLTKLGSVDCATEAPTYFPWEFLGLSHTVSFKHLLCNEDETIAWGSTDTIVLFPCCVFLVDFHTNLINSSIYDRLT